MDSRRVRPNRTTLLSNTSNVMRDLTLEGIMRTLRAWMLCIVVLVIAMAPVAVAADDRHPVRAAVEDNWVEPLPDPWFCLFPPVGWICFPPF